MHKNNETWLAAYLYYAEPWEEFLARTVDPFIRSILERKLGSQYFFIRYWEKGPHIRLRFKGAAQVLESKVKPELETYFNDYFQKHPSQRQEPGYLQRLPENQQWFPNNSVQFIPYEPEIERYGGPAGIIIAEKQFQASSDTVIPIIRESEQWDYDRALGAAIQMHLGFSFALGMNLNETSAFFTEISNMWFARSYGYEANLPEEELKKRQEITRKAFKENFEKQKESLAPYHQLLWDAFTSGVEFEQEWLNHWIKNMADIGSELKKTEITGTLNHILESYVHMTNNRLGILNRDEAFLGYLIKESLKYINKP